MANDCLESAVHEKSYSLTSFQLLSLAILLISEGIFYEKTWWLKRFPCFDNNFQPCETLRIAAFFSSRILGWIRWIGTKRLIFATYNKLVCRVSFPSNASFSNSLWNWTFVRVKEGAALQVKEIYIYFHKRHNLVKYWESKTAKLNIKRQ